MNPSPTSFTIRFCYKMITDLFDSLIELNHRDQSLVSITALEGLLMQYLIKVFGVVALAQKKLKMLLMSMFLYGDNSRVQVFLRMVKAHTTCNYTVSELYVYLEAYDYIKSQKQDFEL